MGIFDQFQSPAPVDVAGTPFQDQPSAVSKLLFGQPSGPDVRDPQRMAPARYIVAGGKTLDPAQDAAWDEATASPRAKKVREIMGSEPMRRLMDLANFIGPGPKAPRPVMAPEGPKGIRAYHGSPHDFDRFDLSKIGTGEGAQAYGHGLYMAESEAVARGYRDRLGAADWHKTNDPAKMAFSDIQYHNGNPEAALASWKNTIRTARPGSPGHESALKRLAAYESGEVDKLNPGRMYEVNIKADPADFLDWDVPLSQQSEKVRGAIEAAHKRALEATPETRSFTDSMFFRPSKDATPDMAIQDYMKLHYGPSAASNALRKAGIPGIRYKDQGSRGAEGGTSNYVVFSDDLIDIIRKYGLAGLLAGGGALSQGNGGNGDAF